MPNQIEEALDLVLNWFNGHGVNLRLQQAEIAKSGALIDSNLPSGTITINTIENYTDTSKVRLQILGRDDISGIDQFRVSNNGTDWTTLTYSAPSN